MTCRVQMRRRGSTDPSDKSSHGASHCRPHTGRLVRGGGSQARSRPRHPRGARSRPRRGDRHGAGLAAAAGAAEDGPEAAADDLGRGGRRRAARRSEPARPAAGALCRCRPDRAHGRVRDAARAASSPAHDRVRRAAVAPRMEIPGRAGGARGARRPDGARRDGPGLGRAPQAAGLPAARLEPHAEDHRGGAVLLPARPASTRSWPIPTSWPACCR